MYMVQAYSTLYSSSILHGKVYFQILPIERAQVQKNHLGKHIVHAHTANVDVPGLVYIMENLAKTPDSNNKPPGISGHMDFTSFFPQLF